MNRPAIRAYFDSEGSSRVRRRSFARTAVHSRARFVTHLTISTGTSTRMSDDLYLKRLIVGGLEKVYEISNGGGGVGGVGGEGDRSGRERVLQHSPRLHATRVVRGLPTTTTRCAPESLVERASQECRDTKVTFRRHEIALSLPWQE